MEVRPKKSKWMSNQSYTARWIAWNLLQISRGVMWSACARVSVAVPYSSVPHTYSVFSPRCRQNRANTSALSTQPIRLPRCGTLFTYGNADVIRMFCSPATGRISRESYTRFRFSVATAVAADANCFFSAFAAGDFPAGDALGAAVLGQDFWACRTLVPMKVGAFLGASPARTARAALGVKGSDRGFTCA